MTIDELHDSYFRWMHELVYDEEILNGRSYSKLLANLDRTQFIYSLPMDGNRAIDGIDLRYRFGYDNHIPDHVIANNLDIYPCSVLEMMVALSLRCEEDIMLNPSKGNRTGKWFWTMIDSLNLLAMSDDNFDIKRVDYAVEKFMYRKYPASGNGSLFHVRRPLYDMRSAEIWCQMNWYLSELGDDDVY